MEPSSGRSKKADVIQYKNIPTPTLELSKIEAGCLVGGELFTLGSIQAEIVLSQGCCRTDSCFR